MIVLGNASFATGMKLAGIKDSFVVEDRDRAGEVLKKIPPDETLIVVNASVLKLAPELHERMKSLVIIPDNPEELVSVADLKDIVKSAIGFEIKF